MRTRGALVFVVALAAAAVGMAVVAASGPAPSVQGAGDGQSAPPQGPPPGAGRGGPGRGGPGGIEQALSQLHLTSAQAEQVKALLDSRREAEAQYQEELGQYAEQMRALIEAGTFDEDAVRALALKEAAVTVELRIIGARTESAIYQLLTAEQKQELARLKPRPTSDFGRAARGGFGRSA